MLSDGTQTDFVEIQRMAEAYRASAEAAMRQPFFTQHEREDRRDFYLSHAERLEAML